jgi:hypothetical protein
MPFSTLGITPQVLFQFRPWRLINMMEEIKVVEDEDYVEPSVVW